MALHINGTGLSKLYINGADMDSCKINDTTVFQSNGLVAKSTVTASGLNEIQSFTLSTGVNSADLIVSIFSAFSYATSYFSQTNGLSTVYLNESSHTGLIGSHVHIASGQGPGSYQTYTSQYSVSPGGYAHADILTVCGFNGFSSTYSSHAQQTNSYGYIPSISCSVGDLLILTYSQIHPTGNIPSGWEYIAYQSVETGTSGSQSQLAVYKIATSTTEGNFNLTAHNFSNYSIATITAFSPI